MNVILSILTFLGAVGLFMYGMRVMSDALQKFAGMALRQKLAAITRNRIKGIVSGTVITGTIQSSSAITVMVVSFVNAGLLTLNESAGLIIGANIGTTFTAWLISLLGFKITISTFTLPLIGISLPLIFSRNVRLKYWGEFVIGFALIFIGLEFIKSVFPDNIQNYPQIINVIATLSDHGFISVLWFIALGFVITSIMQSSSVTSAITLVLCYKGWINFEYAAAMIIGENIGTTVTANIAAMIANAPAKTVALFHFFFNLFGLIWILPLFYPVIGLINKTVFSYTNFTVSDNVEIFPVALALFHSSFNIINTVILYKFTPQILSLSQKIISKGKSDDNVFGLKYFHSGIFSTSELNIVQVKNEIYQLGKKSMKMFFLLYDLFKEVNQKQFDIIYSELKGYNQFIDELENDIHVYRTKISDKDLSLNSSSDLRVMLKVADELNGISGTIFTIAKIIKRKKKKKIWFTQDIRNNLNHMFKLNEKALIEMTNNLQEDYLSVNIRKAENIEKELNKFRKTLYKSQLDVSETHEYKIEAAVIYNDIYNRLEQLGDYIFNITQILVEFKNH